MSDETPWDQWSSDDGSGFLGILDPSIDDNEPLPDALESLELSPESNQETEQPERDPRGSPDVFLNQTLPSSPPAIKDHSSLLLAPLDDNYEFEYVPVTADGLPPAQTISPRVTQEQVNRQMQKCLRDGQELSRLLRKGTREWWMGPTNTARKRKLWRKFQAFNTEIGDICTGRRRIGDAAQELAAESIRMMDKGLAPILRNPARHGCDAVVVIAKNTAAPFYSIGRVVRGEYGSQATPCRHHVTDTGEEGGEEVLVDVEPEGEEAATLLGSPENWELV